MLDSVALRSRLLIDPYVLTARQGQEWIAAENPAPGQFAVSQAFYEALQSDPDGLDEALFAGTWPPIYRPVGGLHFLRLNGSLGFLRSVEHVSYQDVELPEPNAQVTQALLEVGGLYSRILADEWAFLQSRSAMISRRRRAIDAFRHAGAVVIEFGIRLRDQFIQVVVPGELPEVVTPRLLTRVGAKWLVVGGATGVGAMAASSGSISQVVGAMAGVVSVPVVRAFDT